MTSSVNQLAHCTKVDQGTVQIDRKQGTVQIDRKQGTVQIDRKEQTVI